uniref:Zinc metalloproteinase n=1 Tax=Rhabditophanes sp. KR3021 TaxID=114890 RepID=A0AC35UFF0_9BILA
MILFWLLGLFISTEGMKLSEKTEKTKSMLPPEDLEAFTALRGQLYAMSGIQQQIFSKSKKDGDAEYTPKNRSDDDDVKDSPMQNPNLFQGDMMLTPDQSENVVTSLKDQLQNILKGVGDAVKELTGGLDDAIGGPVGELVSEVGNKVGGIIGSLLDNGETVSKKEKRSLKTPLSYEWAFPIKYYLSPSLAATTRTMIDSALADIQANTCVKYVKQASPISGTPGINVIYSDGCWSYVGRIYSNQPQDLSLGEGCQWNGVIQHEFGHSLGLEHEQQRPDRDGSIYVYPANMMPGSEDQFVKASVGSVKDFGVAFDMGSTMLYGSYDFSSNGQKTMAPKNANFAEDLGQYTRLSFSDFKILAFYYCNTTCATKITCQNGGYQNPNSCAQCLCPNGFAGTLCTGVKSTGAACGTTELKATATAQTLTKTGAINCYFRITTDAGYKIKIIVSSYKVSTADPCVVGKGLEIKYLPDMANSGNAFCGTSTAAKTITTATNLALIHFPGVASTHTFSLTYQRVA